MSTYRENWECNKEKSTKSQGIFTWVREHLGCAPPHWHLAVREFLNTECPQHWIGQNGPQDSALHLWPPRSPDLAVHSLYLWGFVKDLVYEAVQVGSDDLSPTKGVLSDLASLEQETDLLEFQSPLGLADVEVPVPALMRLLDTLIPACGTTVQYTLEVQASPVQDHTWVYELNRVFSVREHLSLLVVLRSGEAEGHQADKLAQPAHVKACFLGSSLTIPITDGKLNLGTWQGIWLCEHRDHAGSRKPEPPFPSFAHGLHEQLKQIRLCDDPQSSTEMAALSQCETTETCCARVKLLLRRGVRLLSPCPTPNLEDQGLVITFDLSGLGDPTSS
ncbi:hypothetical protein PR048_006185 [Dryococelus australis]|uniref:Uncharacterized protein n=1 Tax=Dryococelus australis TaxID=614101 RepID=A0ABQ9IA88_9NEOP|nr:hypothetical protein PR048_006185 [Dryococelus australis]